MVRRADRRDIAAVDVVGIEQAQLIFDAQDAAHRVVEPRGADRPGLRLAQRAVVEPLPAVRRPTHVKARIYILRAVRYTAPGPLATALPLSAHAPDTTSRWDRRCTPCEN